MIDKRVKHGHWVNGKPTRTYSMWGAMVHKCRKHNIQLSPDWQDFGLFLRDMGCVPDKFTLRRIYLDDGYSDDNCRWGEK